MESYAQVLNYGILFFVSLITLEFFYGLTKGVSTLRALDAVSSLSSGITNVIKDVLGLTVVVFGYSWVQSNVAIFRIDVNWTAYVLTFIAMDFAGYWMHRYEHKINLLWNNHIIHHSSEEYNLPCALRQEVSKFFSFYGLLLIPIALIGVPPEVVAIVAPIHLFAQFWYHTRMIGKMGFLELFLVTPSHHRVHHAMNGIYLDKNFSQIFIIWDRMFGTFQPELENVPPVYGVKRPVRTWNPFLINFQHLALLVKDAVRTENWKDKLRVFYMPTGWRPKDVTEKYPVVVVDDVNHLEKYDVKTSTFFKGWAWFQLITTLALMLYLFNNLTTIGMSNALYYGVFLLISVFSYTALMDLKKYALLTEVVRLGLGMILIAMNGGWFGIDQWIPGGTYLVGGFLVISLLLSGFLLRFEKGESPNYKLQGQSI